MSEFRGEMKTLVQTYVELLYPDDLEMQTALFENITTGKASVTLEEMQDYVATRSSWYAEIEAVNPAMAVIHNQNDEFVGTVEVMDMDEDPDGVEVFINDEQMNEISSTHLYEDDRFWEDYDAETFEAGGGLGKNQRNLMQRIIEGYQSHGTYAIVQVKTSKYCDGYTPRMLDSLYRKNMIKYLDNEGNPDIGFKVIDLNPYQLRGCPAILVKPTNMALQMNAETFNAMSFKQWSQDEMNEELHGGQNMDFDSWLNDEIRTHGNIPLREWGYEEEHDEPEHQHAESMMSKRGKVRTLSGKPHKARKLKKDRYITPEEAKTRLSFRAIKGIDTFAEPFEEIGDFYSGAKGILKIVGLGALVSVGVWITKNKLLE